MLRALPLILAAAFFVSALHAEESLPGRGAKAPAENKNDEKKEKELVAQQLPAYPLKTCVVSGDELGKMGKAVDYIHNGRLIRFCCKGCVKIFKKNPEKYLAILDAAAKKAADGKK